MKKFLIALVLVLALGGFIVYERRGTADTTPPPPSGNGGKPPVLNLDIKSKAGLYVDGSYNGPATDAFFGTIQVKAIISGGKLTDIQFLQFPDHAGHTSEVSARALPILKSEAIQAQSANVDIVSGATQTSQGFQHSLDVALILAKA